jgi:hypothetical protein
MLIQSIQVPNHCLFSRHRNPPRRARPRLLLDHDLRFLTEPGQQDRQPLRREAVELGIGQRRRLRPADAELARPRWPQRQLFMDGLDAIMREGNSNSRTARRAAAEGGASHR